MRFLGALKSLTSPEKVAEVFVRELIESSNANGNGVCLHFATDFANDCLLGIGLDCAITAEQIEQSTSYEWPKEQLMTYRFEYQQKKFQCFKKCLELICKNFGLEHQIFSIKQRDLGVISDDNNIESPLYLLIEFMAIWCNVFRKLLEENRDHEKWLNEPLARINFSFFLNCHELGINFNWEEPELLSICKILYKSALKGLRYRETHTFILQSLLKLCEGDFLTFHEYSSKSVNFFYEAFSVAYKDVSHLQLYKTLVVVLTNNSKSSNISNRNIVTNILNEILLQPRMLEVYYNTLITKKKNTLNIQILEEALIFLKLLQRQMLDVSKFNVSFMEAILESCAQNKLTLGGAAADLYITIMRRMTTDPVILKHLLLGYAKCEGAPTRQSIFIRNIYKHFDYIHIYKNIYDIIEHQNGNEMMRVTAAQVLLTIACMRAKSPETGSMDAEIQPLLKILVNGLKELSCQNSILILLQILRVLPIKQWHVDLIESFMRYAIGALTTFGNNFQYPLLMNISCLFMDCLQHVKQWQHLGDVADKIMTEFLEVHQRRKESNNIEFHVDVVHYYNILKRLNIVLKVPFDLYDNINDILSMIVGEFLLVPKNGQMHTFMDLYAFEIMCSCILKLSKNELDLYRSIALEQGKSLAKFLWSFLKDIKKLLKLPVMHIKTYFNIMVTLLCCLPINMEVTIYQTLNEILIQLNFMKHPINEVDGDEPMQLQRERFLQYQQLMMRNFVNLHQMEHIKINTNIVWKLCIYYKLSQHQFNNELKELLITLAKNHLSIYKHILPVLIYNLYKITPHLNLRSIEYIISEHKQIMFTRSLIKDQELMCCHVVLTLLQIIQKSIELHTLSQKQQGDRQNQASQNRKNRLRALTHLHMWLKAVNFKDNLRKSVILNQLKQLQNYNLHIDEYRLYENVRAKVERL